MSFWSFRLLRATFTRSQEKHNSRSQLNSRRVESKRGSGDTPTRRVRLCVDPHGSVVGATKFHDRGTLSRSNSSSLQDSICSLGSYQQKFPHRQYFICYIRCHLPDLSGSKSISSLLRSSVYTKTLGRSQQMKCSMSRACV